ncbi:MAG: cysteine desulfurase [Lachnospiraceae bacterium]|nr:cysteine desulfurase [Lachnospiraceae bacterium]
MAKQTEIYLDNAATTRCDEEVLSAMTGAFRTDYGNPSSMHRKGFEAQQLMNSARKTLAGTLRVTPAEILFTSGGTESDNLALLGCARANARRGRHLITTSIEHAAVAKTMEALVQEGFELTVLPVDSFGLVDPSAAAEAVREDTVLISVMAVNNEIGSVQDLPAISRAVRAKKPDVLFHTDAVQAYGKVPIDVKTAGIDLLSVSGHKFHGPKGCGFLYIRKGVKLLPILYGGGQQNGLRSGTDHVPGAVGLAAAAGRAFAGQQDTMRRLEELRDGFIKEVRETTEDIRVNGPAGCLPDDGSSSFREKAAPHIVSLSFPGVRAEVLLHALEEKGIYVSAGSACSSHAAKNKPGTATLRAIGLEERYLESTIRVSLSKDTTKEELHSAACAIAELVPSLRRFQPG